MRFRTRRVALVIFALSLALFLPACPYICSAFSSEGKLKVSFMQFNVGSWDVRGYRLGALGRGLNTGGIELLGNFGMGARYRGLIGTPTNDESTDYELFTTGITPTGSDDFNALAFQIDYELGFPASYRVWHANQNGNQTSPVTIQTGEFDDNLLAVEFDTYMPPGESTWTLDMSVGAWSDSELTLIDRVEGIPNMGWTYDAALSLNGAQRGAYVFFTLTDFYQGHAPSGGSDLEEFDFRVGAQFGEFNELKYNADYIYSFSPQLYLLELQQANESYDDFRTYTTSLQLSFKKDPFKKPRKMVEKAGKALAKAIKLADKGAKSKKIWKTLDKGVKALVKAQGKARDLR